MQRYLTGSRGLKYSGDMSRGSSLTSVVTDNRAVFDRQVELIRELCKGSGLSPVTVRDLGRDAVNSFGVEHPGDADHLIRQAADGLYETSVTAAIRSALGLDSRTAAGRTLTDRRKLYLEHVSNRVKERSLIRHEQVGAEELVAEIQRLHVLDQESVLDSSDRTDPDLRAMLHELLNRVTDLQGEVTDLKGQVAELTVQKM